MNKNNNDDFTQISIRLPNKLLWEIEELAEKEHRTRNNMIEHLLWTALPSPEDMRGTTASP
jgi:metal-responsive CopG/Arc/MetJ family transcriptional regulator